MKTNAVFDSESKAAYSVRVRTTDPDGLFLEKVFVVNVKDVDDAPPIKLNLKSDEGDGDKVQGLLDEVTSYRSSGKLSKAQADVLLGMGNVLLLSVQRR